jgi:hypothetical protein
LNKFEQVWTSLNKFEQVWTSLNKFEQVWTSLNKFEQVEYTIKTIKQAFNCCHKTQKCKIKLALFVTLAGWVAFYNYTKNPQKPSESQIF